MKNQHALAPERNLTGILEKVFYILQDGILILDHQHQIVYINDAAKLIMEKKTGFKSESNYEFLSWVSEERKELVSAIIDEAFEGQPSSYILNYPQHGNDTWFEFSYFPMNSHGLIPHVCIRARDITEKILLEQKLETQRKNQHHSILKATIDAQEKQRSEIGRELHDNVNQVLTTVKLYNEICLSEEVLNKNMLLRSVQQINYCIETLRNLSKALASPSIEDIGLKESIKELADSVDATMKMTVSFYSYGVKNHLINQELQTTIFRIAQEQLTNVLKYSKASSVDVMLVGTTASIALSIKDDGAGFDLDEKRKGVGITNMISRAEAWGGLIEFKTARGQGCSMMVEFPIA